jgi:hypothetical protein
MFAFRKRRRSNLCLNKPKQRAKLAKLYILPGDTAATGERPPNSSDISSTPMDQRLPVFQDDMLNAPQKKKNIKSNFRKRLFRKSTLETMTEEIMEILPGFLQKLHHENLCYDFCNFVKLVCNKKFPLTNISFLLFLDVVRWYSLPRTSMMTYKDDTMKSWRVIYRLFHGKILRFLSGLKSTGRGVHRTVF